MPMAVVAVEQYLPKAQRVIDDGLAAPLLPLGAMIFVRFLRPRWMRDWIIGLTEKSDPGIWGGMLCRKSYIDEKLVASRNEIEAIVNLGAGFDTRPYRLSALSNLPVWEVDHRENVQRRKRSGCARPWGRFPPTSSLSRPISTVTILAQSDGPGILRGQAGIFRLGSGKSIPNRPRCESNLRLACQRCTG
jgi:methyltransferase (TIGR00027 family)